MDYLSVFKVSFTRPLPNSTHPPLHLFPFLPISSLYLTLSFPFKMGFPLSSHPSFPPHSFLPLEVGPSNPAQGLGERCKPPPSGPSSGAKAEVEFDAF